MVWGISLGENATPQSNQPFCLIGAIALKQHRYARRLTVEKKTWLLCPTASAGLLQL
jgi:hypothetical protein